MLILNNVDNLTDITCLLKGISSKNNVPLSTLKLNARILKALGLVEFNGSPARATMAGKLVLDITRGETDG